MKVYFDIAEVKTIKAKNELDRTYQVRFLTNQPEILDLGKLPPDTIIECDINILKERNYGTNRQA